jgi:hypothetical protein
VRLSCAFPLSFLVAELEEIAAKHTREESWPAHTMLFLLFDHAPLAPLAVTYNDLLGRSGPDRYTNCHVYHVESGLVVSVFMQTAAAGEVGSGSSRGMDAVCITTTRG